MVPQRPKQCSHKHYVANNVLSKRFALGILPLSPAEQRQSRPHINAYKCNPNTSLHPG